MTALDPHRPDALPHAYSVWHRRTLAAALVLAAVGFVALAPTVEYRVDFGDGPVSTWLVLGAVSFAVGSLGPLLVGFGLAVAALVCRRLGRSCRLAHWAWVVWVLGPLPVLLLPISHLFGLDAEDAARTSTNQVRYLLEVTAPAFFALLPGALKAALVLERFLPESRVPGYVVALAAPACVVAYLLPLAVLAQVAFHTELYLGLLLLACSPLVPLLAVRRLLRPNTPERAARLLRTIKWGQGSVAFLGVALLAGWAGDHPLLKVWLGDIDAVLVLGVVARVLAGKWLTTVVVTDLLVAVLHRARNAARASAGSPEEDSLTRRFDSLGDAMR